MRRILITNDDGIRADGIARLAQAAKRYGQVCVIAPLTQRSAASHSITLHSPINVYPETFPVEGVRAYGISGTPGDCVRLGVLSILPEKPDVVLAGINYGLNAGTDIQYSATVGAALEAGFLRVQGIALSEGVRHGHLITDRYLEQILDEVIDQRTAWDEIINVNFPSCSEEAFAGILRGRSVSEGYIFKDRYLISPLPDGGSQYIVEGIYQEEAEEGSDLRALFDHYISIGTVRNVGAR